VAFEPDPRNAPLFAEAAGGQENIELRRLAVSESPGTAAFVLHSSSAQSRIATGATQSGELVQVAVTTVDEVAFGEKLPVGGIKIDVEGFDRQVLRGAERTLRELRPVVCTESEWDPELEAFATRVGYRVGAFVGNPDHAIEFSFAPGRGRPTCPMLFLVPEERVDDMRTVAAGIALGRQE
jgi:FkbM family methyltransferase